MKIASPLIVKIILGKMFLRVEFRAPGIKTRAHKLPGKTGHTQRVGVKMVSDAQLLKASKQRGNAFNLKF